MPRRTDLLQIEIRIRDEAQWIQVIQPDRPVCNLVLPTAEDVSCHAVVTRQPNGWYSVNVHLGNVQSNVLLQYFSSGDFRRADEAVGCYVDQAEALLQWKKHDPISAAAGAYVLLRLGGIERLREWTENLRRWFAHLPDGAAIRCEHLAQAGRHIGALEAFLELRHRGLRWFSSGLSFALDRLRYYQRLDQTHAPPTRMPAGLDPVGREFLEQRAREVERSRTDPAVREFRAAFGHVCEPVRALIEKLDRFARYTDFSGPLLCYTGLDPNEPSSAPFLGSL